MKRIAATIATAALLAAVGCTNNKACDGNCSDEGCDVCAAESTSATLSSANDTCPLMGTPVKSSVRTVSFEGNEIGFCCPGCADKFEKMSDSDKAAALASN